jgi:hypothetical protein
MFTLGDIILLPWLGWENFFSRNVHTWRGYYSSLGLVGKLLPLGATLKNTI